MLPAPATTGCRWYLFGERRGRVSKGQGKTASQIALGEWSVLDELILHIAAGMAVLPFFQLAPNLA